MIYTFYSWLQALSVAGLALSVALFLPLGLLRRTRHISAIWFTAAFSLFAVTLWLRALLETAQLWGTIAVVIGLLFALVGVIATGLLATLFHGEWSSLLDLVLLLVFTVVSAIARFYLREKIQQEQARTSA